MATLSITNAELIRATLREMGIGRDPSSLATDAATEADVREVLRSGLRRAYYPEFNGSVYHWRWLEKYASFSVPDVFKSGTITVSGGTVTLAGDTWPTWAGDALLKADGHNTLVASRDSDTALTVPNTELSIAAGTSFELHRYKFPMPSDFSEWLDGVMYIQPKDSTTAIPPASVLPGRTILGASESELRLRLAVGHGTPPTSHYALTTTPDADGYDIMFWPLPEAKSLIQGVYLALPDDKLPTDLSDTGDPQQAIVQAKPPYAQVFIEAILAAAEAYNDDGAGIHEERFGKALARAVLHDKTVGGSYDFSYRPSLAGEMPVLPVDFSDALL